MSIYRFPPPPRAQLVKALQQKPLTRAQAKKIIAAWCKAWPELTAFFRRMAK